MYDRPLDLSTQIQELTRSTTNTLLSPLQVVTGNNSNEPYFDVKSIIDMDWDDTTHEIHTEFIPSNGVCDPDRTLLTILTKETIKADLGPSRSTLLSVSVLLGHYRTQYHTRYIPLEWNLNLIKTEIYDQREYHFTGGAAIATMRSLAIQMGISLAVQNRRLNSTTIDDMRTHGVPQSQETSFLRLGLDRIIDLIKNAMPSDTTN
jgi:hypothetical protein